MISSTAQTYDCPTPGHLIVLEGIIGAGKSTLCTKLVEALRHVGRPVHLFEECVQGHHLDLFFSDKDRYAWWFQSMTLHYRKTIFMEAIELVRKGITVIIDRGLFGDNAFELFHHGEGRISLLEHETYLHDFNNFRELMLNHVDLLVYLDVTPEVALKRIKDRNRSGEKDAYDIQYLSKLKDAYAVSISNFVQWSAPNPTVTDIDSDSDSGKDIVLPFDHPALLFVDSVYSPQLKRSVDNLFSDAEEKPLPLPTMAHQLENHHAEWENTVLFPVLDRLGVKFSV